MGQIEVEVTEEVEDQVDDNSSANSETDDPDELEILELERQIAEAEGKANDPEPNAEGDEAEADDAKDESDTGAEEDDQSSASPMIPKSRFDELLSDREKARQEAADLRERLAYLEGQNSARQQEPQAAPAEPEPTPEERINALNDELDGFAAQVDSADIGMADYRKHERRIEAEVAKIRQEAAATTTPSSPAPGSDDAKQLIEMRKAEHVRTLREQHPYADKFAADKGWREYLTDIARANLKRMGQPIKPQGGPLEDMRLQKAFAELTDHYGPSTFPDVSPANANSEQRQENPALSEAAKARKDKIDLKNAMPPDTANLGRSPDSQGATEDQLASMSSEQLDAYLEAHPDQEKKIMGLE